jgi:hypothetical protein
MKKMGQELVESSKVRMDKADKDLEDLKKNGGSGEDISKAEKQSSVALKKWLGAKEDSKGDNQNIVNKRQELNDFEERERNSAVKGKSGIKSPAEGKAESKAVSPEEIKAKNEEKAKAGISYGRTSTTGAEIAGGGGAFTPPAAVPQAEGGQSAGRQLESIAITTTVTGEVDVRFDTNMFQAEVVRILGTSDAKKKYTDLGLIVSEG